MLELGALLAGHGALWRAQPFRLRRPAWCAQHPALTRELLALEDEALARLYADDAALHARLAPHVPALARLASLCRLPRLQPGAADRIDERSARDMPGRKRAQIEAFAAAAGAPVAPLLEWCSGKGHLGRWMSLRSGAGVLSVERDARLCAEGAALAKRSGVDQRFVAADVLNAELAQLISGRHAVALHACGELHLTLLRAAAAQGAPALDLAPCCYHLGAAARYRPLGAPDLGLSRDDLRLAVTETVTATPRERRERERERAWKLGFDQLQRELRGADVFVSFRPVPAAWARESFESFCRRLGAREGLAIPDMLDWAALEARAWQRLAEVARLSLLRHAFRRALELWLALERALFLEAAGYRVRLGEFCAPRLTPRNLLISARR